MYKIKKVGHCAGREVVVVRSQERLVASASIDFISWMSDRVPRTMLAPEQRALVDWYEKRKSQPDVLGHSFTAREAA